MTLFGLILIGVAGFALWMYVKSGKKAVEGGDASTPERRTLGPGGEKSPVDLALNDVFQLLDQDFLVEGKITYREDGDEWWEFRLVDGDEEAYLCVEDDDELEVSLWREIDLEIPASGPPETLSWDGVKYRCAERGEASVTRDGRTGRKSGQSCTYWDYEGASGEMLGVERWGGAYETWSGRDVDEGRYDILPGDLVEG